MDLGWCIGMDRDGDGNGNINDLSEGGRPPMRIRNISCPRKSYAVKHSPYASKPSGAQLPYS